MVLQYHLRYTLYGTMLPFQTALGMVLEYRMLVMVSRYDTTCTREFEDSKKNIK